MQNTPQQTTYNDEIDLFELFETIWKGKWLITAITCCFIILAGLYAFTAKEQWTATAQVSVPEPSRLDSYLAIEESYHRYAMLSADTTFDTQKALEEAFTIFRSSLFATDTKLEAISNTEYYQTLSQSLDDETARLRLLNNMVANSLSASAATTNNHFLYNVKFSAETSNNAYEVLVEAINHINNEALELLAERQENRIKNRVFTLETQALKLKNSTEQNRENKTLELQQALQAARAAGITEYAGVSPVIGSNSIINLQSTDTPLSQSSDMLFLLGENYLQAQLDALSNSPIIYPANYYEIQRNTESLQALLDQEIDGQMFFYTSTPKLPLVKDKPRKALILVLGALLGGVIGTFVVLLRSAIRNRRLKNQAS